jgi:hypothetical protein
MSHGDLRLYNNHVIANKSASYVTIINRMLLDSRELVIPRNFGRPEHTLASTVDGVVPVVSHGVPFSMSLRRAEDRPTGIAVTVTSSDKQRLEWCWCYSSVVARTAGS